MNRSDLFDAIESRFNTNKYNALSNECADIIEAYLDDENNTKGKNLQQIRDDLHKEIVQNVKYRSGRFGFIPPFVWIWIASYIIKFIIEWYLHKKGL